MLRVLILSTDLQRGGLPLRLAKLALHIRRAGVEPIIGCLAPPGPLSHELARQGVTTFSCNAAGPFDARCLLRLAEHVRAFDPDVIHASLFHANLAARLVGRLDRARPIITSTVTIEIERPLHRFFESITAGFSDVHVANSEAVAAHLRDDLGVAGDRVVVIPNAIDFKEMDAAPAASRAALGLDESRPLILWAGRMDPVKNLPTFVEVIARLRRRTDVQALLLGDGPVRPAMEREVVAKGLTGAVRFAGWSPDVARWLKCADVLLFPSFTEGCPNVVLEAIACRCPIVASDIPSCRELVRNGIDGLLRPPTDAGALTDALTCVLCDRAKARARADAALLRIRAQHELSTVVGQWLRLYGDSVGTVG
ncbi:MAG TPA: glycosyltransferase [Phycisphaerae bacterium]|nr:glycosyltransferase [Phycisphaerae bacterium]